jgi:site-specific DNA recombinase
MEDAGRIMKTFLKYNIKILTPYKTYDLSNPSDARYIRFELFLAREEFELIRERLAAGKEYRALQGYAPNYLATLGVDSVRGKIFIIEEEAELVREIFNMRADELSYDEISRRLNDRGLITKRGTKYHHTTIKRICINPRYIGKNKWKGQLVDSHAPAIVDMELWNKVQDVNLKYAHDVSHAKNDIYFVKLYCRECGTRMYGESFRRKTRKSPERLVYLCNGRKRGISCYNKKELTEIHDYVYRSLVEMFNNNALLDALIAKRSKTLNVDIEKIELLIKGCQRKIKQSNVFLSKLDNDYQTGALAAARYSDMYEKTSNQITAMELQIKQFKNELEYSVQLEDASSIIEKVNRMLKNWDREPNSEKKKVINAFFPRIEVSKTGELYMSHNFPVSI